MFCSAVVTGPSYEILLGFFSLGQCHLAASVRNVQAESPREASLMGKKGRGLEFSCLRARSADRDAAGDKLLAAELLSRERRGTFKLQEERAALFPGY